MNSLNICQMKDERNKLIIQLFGMNKHHPNYKKLKDRLVHLDCEIYKLTGTRG